MARVTNALVTWDDLALMSLVQKSTPPTGLGIVTKGEMNTYYYINNSISPFSTYTNDRCPPYQTISGFSGVTFDISYTCTGTTQTITINNFGGGDGVDYYASTTTHVDAGAASSGATSLVGGPSSSRSYTNQPASFGVSTRYVKVTSGGNVLIKQAGACCDNGAYYTINIGTYYYCSAGSVFSTTVYQNSNACYTGANIYYDAVHGATSTNYSNSSPSTAAVWVDNGAVRCESCANQKQQTNTNQCSPTYGSTQWVADPSGSTCNYNPIWVNRDINIYWVCVGVDKYYEQINTNPCYTGTQTQTGALYQVNSPDCGYAPFKYLATDCYTSTGTIYSSSNGSLNGVTIQTSTACYLLTIAVMGTAVGPLPSYTVIADCSVCGI